MHDYHRFYIWYIGSLSLSCFLFLVPILSMDKFKYNSNQLCFVWYLKLSPDGIKFALNLI